MKLINLIVIDDDKLNNLICKKVFEMTIPDATIRTFTDPKEGLKYTISCSEISAQNTILFLNINMPDISGWDILDVLQQNPTVTSGRIKILILSSSPFIEDVEKANTYPLVSGFIGKPLSIEKFEKILRTHL